MSVWWTPWTLVQWPHLSPDLWHRATPFPASQGNTASPSLGGVILDIITNIHLVFVPVSGTELQKSLEFLSGKSNKGVFCYL